MAAVQILPAFAYKWGQDGTVAALDDTQYKAGWAFVGATPPSVEQFNKVHQIADEKSNYLYGQLSAVFTAAGQVPAAGTLTTLRDSLTVLGTGRLIRTTRYMRVAGVQNVSVDGGANTTTGATTHTRMADTKLVRTRVQGAGSGGAGGAAPSAGLVSLGSPGCSGSYGESLFTAAAFGASQTVTVGLGSAGNSGAVGGTSSVGALITAPGGSAAGGLAGQTPPTVNGTGTLAAAPTGANLLSIQGAAPHLTIAQSASVGNGGAGGASMFGPGGNGPVINTNGTTAVNPGAGGSGCLVNSGGGTATGGAGAPGIVIIEEYA